jgi:hypothetical protein
LVCEPPVQVNYVGGNLLYGVWTNTDILGSTQAARERWGTTVGPTESFKELGDMAGNLIIERYRDAAA